MRLGRDDHGFHRNGGIHPRCELGEPRTLGRRQVQRRRAHEHQIRAAPGIEVDKLPPQALATSKFLRPVTIAPEVAIASWRTLALMGETLSVTSPTCLYVS